MTETDVLARQIAKGIRLHQRGQLADAEKIYKRVLRKDPDNVNALNFLGVLTQQRGDGARAIGLLEKCISRNPQYEDAHQNLVRILREQGDNERALQIITTWMAINPYSAEAFLSQGLCYEDLGQYAKARESLERSLQLDGSHIKGRLKLAEVLRQLGEDDIAVEHYLDIIDTDPTFEAAYESLGMLLYKHGEIERAADIYRRWLDQFPDDARAAHLYAACSDEVAPDRASDAFVAEVFDSFADTFDEQLTLLNYQAPQLVADALTATDNERRLAVLDAGCGTGLCGPMLRHCAARLVGVDLSAAMLEKAALLDVYDELHEKELVAFMHSTAEKFDCVISADTLVYFGDLLPAFAAVSDVLNPGGEFVFTVEQMSQSSGEEYRLNPHGRYSHSRQYVADSLAARELDLERADDVILRQEAGQDVQGLLVVARKPAGKMT